jgi:hypothetical protein
VQVLGLRCRDLCKWYGKDPRQCPRAPKALQIRIPVLSWTSPAHTNSHDCARIHSAQTNVTSLSSYLFRLCVVCSVGLPACPSTPHFFPNLGSTLRSDACYPAKLSGPWVTWKKQEAGSMDGGLASIGQWYQPRTSTPISW